MRKIKNKIYAFVCLFVLVISSIVLYSCKSNSGFSVYDASGSLVFNKSNTEITVEYGEAYNLPMQVQVNGKKVANATLELYNEAGEKVKLSYGSYSFKSVGIYTAKYTADGEVAEYKIVCKDTVLPEVKIISAEYTGSVGASVALPKFTYSDLAGVEKENVYIEVVSPLGNTTVVSGTELLLEEVGVYSVTIVVKDNNGLTKRETISVEALPVYNDETKGENVLYSFDNEEYIGLVTTFNGDSTITREIITEGYPALNNDTQDNGVLKVSSTKTFGNVYTRFLMHEEIPANKGYRIMIRFALSTDTDYVKVFRNYKNLENSEIIGQCLGVKANTWYEMEINPLDYGLYVNVKDFAFLYRDSGDTVLYIDEIYFTEMPFTDTERADNVVADFDEDGYLYYVYDNIFKDPTSDHGKRVPGSEFSLVSETEAPAKNGNDTKAPNLGMSGKALKMVVFDKYMGLNYFFPEKINVKNTISLTLRSYIEKRPNSIIIGCFNEKGYDVGQTLYYSTSLIVGQWFDWVIPGEVLKQFTTTEEISGIYLQFTFANGAEMRNTMYIDEIFTVEQNANSEQLNETIATFENENFLVNIGQNVTKTTATIGWVENVNGKEGVLSVKSNNSNDGFSYYFDEPVVLTVGCLNILSSLAQNNTISKISVYGIVDGRDDALIGQFDKSLFANGTFVAMSVLAQDVLEKTSTGVLYGLRFVIETTSASENNILYVDSVSLFDVSTDVNSPVIEGVDSTAFSVLKDTAVDLSALNVTITDSEDPNPTWVLVGVEDEDGNAVSTEKEWNDFVFMPTKSGVYKIYIKALDWAKNESPVYTATLQVNIMDSQKDWYLNALNFDSASDIALVENSYVTPSIVKDRDKTVLSAGLNAKDLRGYIATLALDLGGIYKANEIDKIEISFRVSELAGLAGKTWYKAGVNASSSGVSEFKVSSAMLSNGTAQPTVTTDYITLTIAGDLLVTALGDGDKTVESIAFWNSTSGGAGHTVTMYIDSIKISEKVPEETIEDYAEALLFNEEKSLLLVENSYVKDELPVASIVTDGDKAVLSGVFTAKDTAGYLGTLTINLGGEYKANEVGAIVITFRIPELVGNAGKTWYKAGVNVSATSVSEFKVSSTMLSNGTAQPVATADYITMTIAGDLLVTALGNGDEIVNNIALWNSTSGGAQPVNIYIDSIVINKVEENEKPEVPENPEEGGDGYAGLLLFNDEKSLELVENSHVKDDFAEASIVKDGDKSVLSASFSAKDKRGYSAMLVIDLGGEYKASEIGTIVITFKVSELVGAAGKTWYKAGVNASSSGVSEFKVSGGMVSNGNAQPAVTEEYITITVTGEMLAELLGGDTVVENIAFWNSTSGGSEQPVNVYIDSIVINLA